jgi:hypothetical protein
MPRLRLPRPRLSYANVASTLAVMLCLSVGGAYAAATIGSSDIRRNAVKSKHIAPENVKTSDIRNNAVNSAKVKNRALKGSDFALRADGVAMAAASVAGGTTISYSFNRVGGPISVTNPSVGTWQLTIPGGSFTGFTKLVHSLTGGYNHYCYLNSSTGSTLEIRCRDFADTLVNGPWTFVLFKDQVGAPPRPAPRAPADAG